MPTPFPKCPICKLQAKSFHLVDGTIEIYFVECFRCGKYKVLDYVLDEYLGVDIDNLILGKLSSWTYNHQVAIIDKREYLKITKQETLSVDDKALKLLLYLSKKFPMPGQIITDLFQSFRVLNANIEKEEFARLGGITFLDIFPNCQISNIDELRYLLKDYLATLGLIYYDGYIKLLPAGWKYLDEIKNKNNESNNIFIAMRFKDDLLKFSDEFIETAIREAGYEPIRIDKHVHDNIIDDEIIASIRKSKLIVSDFTDNSSGVYFETGFARGLNLPVIYLCEKHKFEDEKQKPHFDVNHYPFLLWERDKGEKIRKELQLRIEALVGKGLSSALSE